MTDDLRTRIAQAIKDVDDMRVCKLSNADIKFIADAVMEVLTSRDIVYNIPTRYVTEWKADDE